ncbi:hypothetical protein, partial [Paucibacter sp. XJ19-41]|uniref:hypothetical protein n=1 Tax=Paucibacter sp. XJ19-41 TaxID=2927824 RepID=UPI00234A4310
SPVTASWDYQFDAAHQLTQVQQTIAGATSTQALLRFDDNGNLRKLCEGTGISGTASDCSGSQTTSLSWDGLDQLVGLAKAGTQALSEAYAYDDAGRRLRKSSGASVSHYVYNGDDIAAEWGGNALSGAPVAVYAHGPGVDEPLMRLTGASGSPDATAAYYVQDGLGSVVALFSAGTAANQTPLGGNTLSTTGDYSAASYPPAHLKDGITVGSDTSGWVAVVANGAAATLSLGSATALERIELMAVS